MALVIVDKREDALGRSNKDSPVSFLDTVFVRNNNQHASKASVNGGGQISYMLRQVSIGDYLIILRTAEGNRLAAIIERKTWKDLGASIPNGHVDNQIKKMKELQQKTGCLLYFVIEGALTYEDDTKVGGKHGLKFNQLHAKARHTMHRGIPFVQTKDPMHTVVMLTKFARDFIMLTARGDLEFKSLDEFTDFFGGTDGASELQDFEGYLNQTAKSIETDVVADIWNAVPGVSYISAPVLMKNFHISEMFTADAIKLDQMQNQIAELTYPSGTRIGKQANKIVCSFLDENYNSTAVKCLSAIKGVGEKAAESIVQAINIRDLCAGAVTADDLAEIYVGKNRLGVSKAGKIHELFHKS